MHKHLKISATPVALVALTTSVAVVADAVKAETPAPRPITNESQLIREIGNDPLNVRVAQPVSQVTSVSQLSDVRPTDWAFTALQSLVERYNCIAGYPDRTYRGQQAMTRFEFAAGLNACLDKINEVIASGLADKVSKEDLEVIARLQEDFAAELASLKGRVDTLEGKVATLERQQFSTTTKLTGEVIFAPFAGSDGRVTTVD
ncbi:MAG: iron uptake porin, partial [Pseudanabaenaceae cyanobacterium]